MSLEQLRSEYLEERIGPLILAEVRGVVMRVVLPYDPEIYAGVSSWGDAGEDLVQSVVVDLLLDEGQLDYVMATAAEIEDFHRLLAFQVRRYLARKRRRTVIDNLLDRFKPLLDADPFEKVGGDRFCLGGKCAGSVSDVDISRAVLAVSLVPKVPPGAGDRAPMVYSAEHLQEWLLIAARTLGAPFRLQDLGKILGRVLTGWVAGFLEDFEAAHGVETPELGPEARAMAERAVEEVTGGWTDAERFVLRGKLEKASDSELAAQLGVSRPTVLARKKDVMHRIRTALEGLDEAVQEAAVQMISLRLAAGESPGEVADE